jgi:predicted RNA-binding Zn-ribbon protein involved in translation (DUF1610 family)
MADFEFFELVNLPFDPPEKAAKKVTVAVEKAKKDLNGILGTANQQLERDAVNGKLSFLDARVSEIFDGAGKLTAKYEELALERTDKEIKNLRAAVALIKLSGRHVITNGTIRKQRAKTKLSKDNVEKAFIEAGFTISEVDPLAAYPKFPTNADSIYSELEALRRTKDPNPQGKDLTLAVDLYAFTAYLSGEPENAAEYRNKSTSEIASLLDGFSKQFSTRNDDLGKLCASLSTKGKSYVFNSDDNRKAYEAHLQYKSSALTELFDTMRRLSESDLSDAKFAEQCIKKISEVFGNYDIALAIYNKEAGLKDEPYIPEKATFHVKCSYCQNIVEFSDVSEAIKANKCSHCGNALYKTCNKCHKNVLISLDKCPDCGFVFASTAMFAKFFAAAEQALRRSDFEEARNCLLQARTADPSENLRTAQLEARITAEEKKYEKPVNDLRKLIADRKYQKASEMLAVVIGNFPGLNVSSFDSQIKTALVRAQTSFANAKNMSQSKKADVCLGILNECVDFKSAIDFLLATPPEACKSFSVALDSIGYRASLSWSRSVEQGAVYRVVRKQGKASPSNEKDGEILIDNTSETSFNDKAIEPGRYYSYAVFSIRYGVFSSAMAKTIVLLADVTNARCEQFETTIRITWNNPKNCTGITIKRTVDGQTATLINNANGSFEDKNIKYGIAYSYNLQTNYNGLPSSSGVDLIITPMIKIESFNIRAELVKGNTYKVSWDIKRNDIDLRILVDDKQIRELKSGTRNCEVNLPPDGFHTITVAAYSGGSWLRSSNSPQVNTYPPCVIDKQASQLREETIAGLQDSTCNVELHMKVNNSLPDNVVGFYYTVRTKSASDSKAPWADKQEIGKAADIHRVSLSAYRKGGEITYMDKAHDESSYYVSLFTIYSVGGNEVVSNASMCRFDRPLTADIFWKVNKPFLSGNAKLTIEINANRPFERIPELVLCACSDGQHLLSQSDPKGRPLMSIPETRTKTSQRTFTNTYDVLEKQLKGLKLFLFETSAVPNENYTLRWNKGFSGKV